MSSLPFSGIVQTHFPGCTLLRAWPLSGGFSAQTTALEIRCPGAQILKRIVRQPSDAALLDNPHAAQDEYRVLQIAYAAGLAVPEPILLDTSARILPGPYLVMAFIDGQPDFAPADELERATRMAEELARIHALGVHPALSFLYKYDENSEIGRRPPVLDETMYESRIRQALAPRAPFLRRNPPVLLHGDFWPGNLLWQSERLAAVIDWEDAALGDPLADLAIARLDLLWIYSRAAMETFTRRYLSISPLDLTAFPCWDLYAALRLVRLVGGDLPAWAGYFHSAGRPDITADNIRAAFRFFIDQALVKI